jgi:hypothetical protein
MVSSLKSLEFAVGYGSLPTSYVSSRPALAGRDKPSSSSSSAVHFASCHPPSVLAGVPMAQMIRLARNCTAGVDVEAACGVTESAFLESARILTRWLKQRGYPTGVVSRAVAVALRRLRSGSLYSNPETGRGRVLGRSSSNASSGGSTDSSSTPSSSSTNPLSTPNGDRSVHVGQGNSSNVFQIVVPYCGQTRRHLAGIERLLDSVLQSAARFYSNQGPGGSTHSSMLSSSRGRVTLSVGGPRLM